MDNCRGPKAIPLYQQIAQYIKMSIMNEEYKEDTPLPSIRNLAVSLKVNNNTIQKAYNTLENEGYIYTVIGKGKFVQRKSKVINNSEKEELRKGILKLIEELIYLGVKHDDLVALINKEPLTNNVKLFNINEV